MTSLHNFFKMAAPSEGKKNFIYDCKTHESWFSNEPTHNDLFVTKKCGIKLWRRNSHFENTPMVYSKPFEAIKTPLLKSHLQKAIRRKNTNLALKTLYSLMQSDKTAALRRIPIIAIEDVCFIQGMSTIVWFIIADKNHIITKNDYLFIVDFVYTMCETDTYYDYIDNSKNGDDKPLTHKKIVNANQNPNDIDEILAAFYRMQYGGMHCDMQLVTNAIKQQMNASIDTPYAVRLKTCQINNNILYRHLVLTLNPEEFIQEAIDFHPYPWIIKKIYSNISQKTGDVITHDAIKLYIWQVESCLNVRKEWSIDRSSRVSKYPLWDKISTELNALRSYIVRL